MILMLNETTPPRTRTRDKLVDVARQLFHQHGYRATGIAEILRAAEVNSGSLYYFFPSKEDLLVAVLESYRELLRPRIMDPAFERVRDPLERVFAVLDGYRQQLIDSGCKEGCPIGNLALEMSDDHPRIRDLVAENFVAWRDAVQECFNELSNRLPEETDTAALSAFVLTVMEGGVMQARAHASLEPYENAVEMLRDYLDRLLADGTAWTRGEREKTP